MQTLQQLLNGELKGAVSLKIMENLTSFPEEIFQLADTLEYLDLSRNKLSSLPKDFGRLKKLKVLFCSDNLFTELPAELGDCLFLDTVGFRSNLIDTISPKALNAQLRWLILTNNHLKELPAEIGKCLSLEKLMLSGNVLTSLPQTIKQCKSLSLLRISSNRLTTFPDVILALPKLAWIAFSGNPFSKKSSVGLDSAIDLKTINLTKQLGEGASGTIHKAFTKINGKKQDVAVKIFKSAVTSDGLPEDELHAYASAGDHAGIIKLIGHTSCEESNRKGLLMELVPEKFYNLGAPPNLSTCTRDVFTESPTLPIAKIIKIATTIASIGGQIHKKGLMHGDLYAHNILIDEQANTLLGDFGAASLYDKKNVTAAAFEKIEVLAFGYLLDDLLSICSDECETVTEAKKLMNSCLLPDLIDRPEFETLHHKLLNLKVA